MKTETLVVCSILLLHVIEIASPFLLGAVLVGAAIKGAALGYWAGRHHGYHRRGRYYDHYDYYDHHHDHYYDHGHYHGHRGHRRRYRWRRDLAEVDAPEVLQEGAAMLNEAFNTVAQEDQAHCGLRLVCELAATDVDDLSQEELIMVSIFRPEVQRTSDSWSISKQAYDKAAEIGFSKRSPELCAQTYSDCPFNAKTIMLSIRDSEASKEAFSIRQPPGDQV